MTIVAASAHRNIERMMPIGARTSKKRIGSDRKRRIKLKKLQERLAGENSIDKRVVACLSRSDGEVIVRPGFGLSDAFAGVIGKKALNKREDRSRVRLVESDKRSAFANAIIKESLERLVTRGEVKSYRGTSRGRLVEVYYLINDS